MNLKKLLRPLLLLVLVNLAACSSGANTKQDDSLYQALGQRDGIAQMVSYSTQNRVLKIFAPMRAQIIDK